LSHCW